MPAVVLYDQPGIFLSPEGAVGILVEPGADVTVTIEDLRGMDLPDQPPR